MATQNGDPAIGMGSQVWVEKMHSSVCGMHGRLGEYNTTAQKAEDQHGRGIDSQWRTQEFSTGDAYSCFHKVTAQVIALTNNQSLLLSANNKLHITVVFGFVQLRPPVLQHKIVDNFFNVNVNVFMDMRYC